MPVGKGFRTRGAVLPPPRVALAVRAAVLAEGARPVAARLGLSDTTTARIAARLPCHRASIQMAAYRLGIELHTERQSLSQEATDP